MKLEDMSRMKPALWIFISIILFVIGLHIFGLQGRANSSAIVSGAGAVNVRTGPSTTYDNVQASNGNKITLPSGYNVTILRETKDDENNSWYEISFMYNQQVLTGYAMAAYIKPKTVATHDANFENYMNQQGFPESYKEGLRILHTEHPNWVFEAVHTGLDWNDSVKEESVIGRNLIQNSAISAWKSMETGAYDAETGTWIVFDGSDWVAASKGLIAYYMDPRNFLDELNVFQFESLAYDASYQNLDGIQTILNDSFMSGTYTDVDGWKATYAEAFLYGAEESGVNPYHLASRSLQELGKNGSASVSGTVSGYEGYFNFYNIGATSSSNPILNGLSFAKQYNDDYLLPWDIKWKAIAGGAIYLGNRYIKVGQDTLYMQKFNVQGDKPYTHQYMTNVQAPSAEARQMAAAYGQSDIKIVFKIPVFRNMPNEACLLPTGNGQGETPSQNGPSQNGPSQNGPSQNGSSQNGSSQNGSSDGIISEQGPSGGNVIIGSSNAGLSNLRVEGYTLTPAFEPNIYNYSIVLPNMVSYLDVYAAPLDPSQTIDGDDRIQISAETKAITVTATTTSGSSASYTIQITMPTGQSSFEGENYSLSASDFIFTNVESAGTTITILYGFDAGTAATTVVNNISTVNCGARIVSSDRKEYTGAVSTGLYLQVLALSDGGVIKEIPLVVYGDLSGDGVIDGIDMLYLHRHMLELAPLSGAYLEAADIVWADNTNNANGVKISTISPRDMLYLQRHLLDMQYIKQK